MVLTALAVALIPLWVVGAAIYLYLSSAQQQSLRAELLALVLNRASAVELFLTERTAMLEALAHTASLDDVDEASSSRACCAPSTNASTRSSTSS
jgi:hypothetical protein